MRNLSIRTQTVIAVSLFCVGVIAGIYFFSFTKISNDFLKFEETHVVDHSQKVNYALLSYVQNVTLELSYLEQLDDLYQFSQDQRKKLEKANQKEGLTRLNLDHFSFWSKKKELIWGSGLSPHQLIPLSLTDIITIKNIKELHTESENKTRYTFAHLEGGNFLLVSLPIISRGAKAEMEGNLIGGIKVDDQFFSVLGNSLQFKIEYLDLGPVNNKNFDDLIIQYPNQDTLNVYGSFRDYKTEKLINYKISLPRDIQFLYQRTMKTFLIAMVFGGIAMVLVVLISVNRLLITRISTLSDLIKRIKETGDLKQKVPELGGDEIGQLGKSFNEMFEEINGLREASYHNEKMASLGEMAGGIAHEINNPITIIAASAHIVKKMISRGMIDNDKILKQIEDIEKTVFRISKIINGLRNVSRDATNEEFAECLLLDILTDTLSITSEKFKAHGIKINVNLDDPIFKTKFSCLRVQLSQVLFNLFGNSFDAIEGREDAWIEIQASVTDDMLVIRCTDSGHGIPKEIQSKIFQPFFTTKEIGKGTGLGLSLSNAIIQRHGGIFTIDNECENTCFVIKLPLKGAGVNG